jgi:trypsin
MKSITISLVVLLAVFAKLKITQGRIVGGKPIEIEEASYTVSLQINGKHGCGGALMSERFILKAAHCELT